MNRGGGAGGGFPGDEDEDAIATEEFAEFFADGGGCFVGDAEHGSGAGFFHVGEDVIVVVVCFLDEVGDFPFAEEFFDLGELVEGEPPGDGEEAGFWDTIGV